MNNVMKSLSPLQWREVIPWWLATCLIVPMALETIRLPARQASPSTAPSMTIESMPTTPEDPKARELQQKLSAVAAMTGQEVERAMAGTNLRHYSVDYRTGALILHFPQNYFPLRQHELPEDMAKDLVEAFSRYVAAVANHQTLKNNLKEIKIVGFSSPLSEFREVQGKKIYNKDLAVKRARSVFQRLFNVSYHTYAHQDYALIRSTINGDGPIQMANGKSLQEFCLLNDCDALNYIMFKPALEVTP